MKDRERLLESARQFYVQLYDVDESRGEELEVSLSETGVLDVVVRKRPKALMTQVRLYVTWDAPAEMFPTTKVYG